CVRRCCKEANLLGVPRAAVLVPGGSSAGGPRQENPNDDKEDEMFPNHVNLRQDSVPHPSVFCPDRPDSLASPCVFPGPASCRSIPSSHSEQSSRPEFSTSIGTQSCRALYANSRAVGGLEKIDKPGAHSCGSIHRQSAGCVGCAQDGLSSGLWRVLWPSHL